MAELILVERHEHVVRVSLNRPESRNALSTLVLRMLASEIGRIREDATIRVVVISGAQDKAFCAGADLKERQGMSESQTLDFVKLIQSTFQSLAELPMPVIAAINGDAFGGGLELALACDLRVAAHHARMGLSECSLGIIPGAGGTQRLPRILGIAKACELIFTARKVCSEEALSIGLVNQLAKPGQDVWPLALSLAQSIASNAPLALRAAKKAIVGSRESLNAGLVAELQAYQEILPTKDRLEGLRAFQEKRFPVFSGS